MIHESFDTGINARSFFDNYDAKAEGLLSSVGEEYIQKIHLFVHDGKFRCKTRFPTPQDEMTMNGLLLGLVDSFDTSAQKYGIGIVPIHFWYTYSKSGYVELYLDPFDCDYSCHLGDSIVTRY
jgi:hypothetical protein